MITFSSNIPTIKLPVARLKKSFDRAMGQILRETIRDWLRFIVPQIPVETGMAKASFMPLGRFLNVVVNISPTRKSYYSTLEGTTQDIGAGETKSDFYIKDDGFVYEFYWTTDVLHYYLEQFYKGPAIPGEHLLAEAEQYFLDVLNTRIENRLGNILSPIVEFDVG